MVAIRIGDIVTRQSHNHDLMFKIVKLYPNGLVELKGLHFRLEADAPLSDLTKVNPVFAERLAHSRERLISARREALAHRGYPGMSKSCPQWTVAYHSFHRT